MKHHLALRSAALLAAVACTATAAFAAIVYSGPLDLMVPEDGPGLCLDLRSGRVVTILDSSLLLPGWDASLGSATEIVEGEDWTDTYTFASLRAQPGLDLLARPDLPYDGLLRLGPGATLDRPDDEWTFGGTAVFNRSYNGVFENDAHWTAGSTGFVGFRLEGNLGWAQVSYNADRSLTLHDFAYAAQGEAIVAGQTAIPEPATTAVLAGLLGGIAVVVSRWCRRAG